MGSAKWKTVAGRYKDMLHSWDEWGQDFHVFNPAEHRGSSRTSLKARARRLNEPAVPGEDQYWLSTFYMVIISLKNTVWRKRDHGKESSREFLAQFLIATLDGALILEKMDFQAIDPCILSQCTAGADDGKCEHIRQVLFKLAGESYSPQWMVVRAFTELLQFPECDCCHSLLTLYLDAVVSIIESTVGKWGTTNLLDEEFTNVLTASGVKRRRIEDVVKDAIMRKASEHNGAGPSVVASSTGLANANLCYKWRLQELAKFRGTCLVEYGTYPRTMHSCFDAARLGKPAKDWLMHVMVDPFTKCAISLAPTVLPM